MLVAVVVFSSASSLVKWSDAPGPTVAFWRMLLSSALWWVVLVVRRVVAGHPFPSRATWRAVLPAGAAFGANISIFFAAINHTSVAHAEFITALTPLVLVPIGMVIFREHLNPVAVPFGVLGLVGLALVLFGGSPGDGATARGDLLVLGSLATWTAYLVFGRKARYHVDVVDFMATLMPIGFVVAAPVAWIERSGDVWPVHGRAWIAIVLLAVLTGMVGHGLIAVAQRRLDVGTISVIQVAQPALAVCWAAVLLRESVSAAQLPGMALVLAGLAGFTRMQQRRPAVAPAIAVACPAAGD